MRAAHPYGHYGSAGMRRQLKDIRGSQPRDGALAEIFQCCPTWPDNVQTKLRERAETLKKIDPALVRAPTLVVKLKRRSGRRRSRLCRSPAVHQREIIAD
jgi:hypothetical protein